MTERHKILVVDDEPHVANITGRVLECEFPDAEIIVTTAPEQALSILQNGDIAVLLCDLQMPVYDGAHVLSVAFESNPRTVSIIITGHATKDSMIRAVNDGHLWRCIEKPWTAEGLAATVREAIGVHEARISKTRRAQPVAPSIPKPEPIEEPKEAVVAGGKAAKVMFLDRSGKNARAAAAAKAPRIPLRIVPKGKERPKERRSIILDSRYKDMELIKEGGSGIIYKAQDSLLQTTVAIKILHEKFTSNKQALEELLREARIAMQLSHKHIVRLHNIEHSKGAFYLVMEWIDGSNLRDTLERVKVLSPPVVMQIVDVCEDAMSYAHRRNVYHRDIKPDNIMVTSDGVLKIIDFGLACIAESFRRTGEVLGTPYYMSPEEIAGNMPDHRADIYSLGVMVHELLMGTLPPHRGPEPMQSVTDYVALASPELPEPVRKVLQKSFEKNPDDRWSDMYEFASNFRKASVEGFNLSG